MIRLNNDYATLGPQLPVQRIRNLARQALLELGATGVSLDHPCQFGEAHDLAIRDVSYVRLPDERQEVMLAHRVERYIPHEHHLVVIFLEARTQQQGRVHTKSRKEELVRPGEAFRSTLQALSVGILANGGEYLPDGAFDPGHVDMLSG